MEESDIEEIKKANMEEDNEKIHGENEAHTYEDNRVCQIEKKKWLISRKKKRERIEGEKKKTLLILRKRKKE